LPASILALAALLIKPFIFKQLLKREGEKQGVAGEIGVRLGQISEFSLLISVVGMESAVLSSKASYLIQTATVITFIASSYWIVMHYPTPIAVSDALRRD
jgi:predicted Kef-type K+ transport protein